MMKKTYTHQSIKKNKDRDIIYGLFKLNIKKKQKVIKKQKKSRNYKNI